MPYTQLPYMVKIRWEEKDDATETATSSFHYTGSSGLDYAADFIGMGMTGSPASVIKAMLDLSGMIPDDIQVQSCFVDNVAPNFNALAKTADVSNKCHLVFETGILIPVTANLPCFNPTLKKKGSDMISSGITDTKMNVKIKELIQHLGGFDAAGVKDPAAISIADGNGNTVDRFLFADMVHTGKEGMRMGNTSSG